MDAIFVNPGRKRRGRRTPPRDPRTGKFRRRAGSRRRTSRRRRSSAPRKRRVRRNSSPAAPRRRVYRRNPQGGIMVNVQDALLGAVGGAVAKAAVRQVENATGQMFDPKMKAAAVLLFGALIQGAKFLPVKFRKPMAVGAQVTGATQLLSSVAPDYFSGIQDVSPYAVQVPEYMMSPAARAAENVTWGMGDAWAENA